MATAPQNPWTVTADRYLAFPDDFPRPSQLIQGQVVVNQPSVRHQRIRDYIHFVILRWIHEGTDRGEVFSPLDVRVDDWNVFAPDLLYFTEPHRPDRDAVFIGGVPDLAVEVRSPSTWAHDVGPKRLRYEAHGLPELWLVDTASNSILLFRRSAPDLDDFDISTELGEEETLTTPLLLGLEIGIRELFDR